MVNRFESGNANLFTSCITYDALGNAAILADITGDDLHKSEWLKEQKNLKTAIENYFGANVEGFDTYRYYDGNTDLRSWICMPLTVEIFDRAEETVNALFSDKLYYDGCVPLQRTTPRGTDHYYLHCAAHSLHQKQKKELKKQSITAKTDFWVHTVLILMKHIPRETEHILRLRVFCLQE